MCPKGAIQMQDHETNTEKGKRKSKIRIIGEQRMYKIERQIASISDTSLML